MGKRYYIVAEEALPEIIRKAAQAGRMLRLGEAKTVGEAAAAVGISRSAFYKYRDAVQPFQDLKAGRILTFSAFFTSARNSLRLAASLGEKRAASLVIRKKMIKLILI